MDPHSFYLLDPDLHSEKLLDPDPQKMNADPQPWFHVSNLSEASYSNPNYIRTLAVTGR